MKAAVVRLPGAPITIEDIDIDQPGPSEVVVRTVAAGVCHSDLIVVDGTFEMAGRWSYPMVIGHESAGIVEQVGALVTYVKPGDHVVTCPSAFCGKCEWCLTGRPHMCRSAETLRPSDGPSRLTLCGCPVAQFANLGSFAEEMLVHENAVVKIPEDFPLDEAALLGCGVTTGLGAALNTAKVAPGSSVAVIGCGGVGLSIIQGARIAGARQLIAVDRLPQRLEMAKRVGATAVVNSDDGDPVEAVRLASSGGVEYSFEAVGSSVTAQLAFSMLRDGGLCTVVGVVRGQDILLPGSLLQDERRIQGCRMGSNRFRVDIPRWLDFYRSGKLLLADLITSHFPLDRVGDAVASLTAGEGVRGMVVLET